MTTFIEDSPRALSGWIVDASNAGHATAAVLTPWATPLVHRGGSGKKPGIAKLAEKLREGGVPFWFDPTTHALQMTGVGDFRYYDEYNLWGGPKGDLSQGGYRREHVKRVFERQRELGAPYLAPTLLLPSGLNNLSTLALESAKSALDLQPTTWLSLSGIGTLWGDGRDLDAHIGAMSALCPDGWFVSLVQPQSDLPPRLTAEEIFGICRTVRALSEYAPVHISHGDFAALPAVAAGATSVGTGWDKRQRVVSYKDYGPRPEKAGQAQWYQHPAFLGLLGTLAKGEGELLEQQDPILTSRLGGLPNPPQVEYYYLQHASQLSAAVRQIQSAESNYKKRFEELDDMYLNATTNWQSVQTSAGLPDRSKVWIEPYQEGLRMYAKSEGWIT